MEWHDQGSGSDHSSALFAQLQRSNNSLVYWGSADDEVCRTDSKWDSDWKRMPSLTMQVLEIILESILWWCWHPKRHFSLLPSYTRRIIQLRSFVEPIWLSQATTSVVTMVAGSFGGKFKVLALTFNALYRLGPQYLKGCFPPVSQLHWESKSSLAYLKVVRNYKAQNYIIGTYL